MKYKVILFDLDDTLLNHQTAMKQAVQICQQTFYQQIPFDILFNKYREINTEFWHRVSLGEILPGEIRYKRFIALHEVFGLDINAAQVGDFYDNTLGNIHHWFEGAKATLDNLKSISKLGVITNGFQNIQTMKYHAAELHQWFDCYIISEQVGFAKPAKEIFDLALSQMKVHPEQVLMVGDSLVSDFQGALNANIDFCWVNHHLENLPDHYSQKPQFMINRIDQLFDKLIAYDRL